MKLLRFRVATALMTMALLAGPTVAFGQETLTIASWGGAFQEAQRKAWFDVVEEELGITIVEETVSGVADVRLQVASGAPTWDLVHQGSYGCRMLEREGNVEKLDPSLLQIKGIAENLKSEGWISNLVYSAVVGWNDEAYPDRKPRNWADMWDTETFPGPRAMRRMPLYTLETALLADGVPMDELYPLDVERAFKKLAEIKDDVAVWWSSGAQSVQVMQDGEVDMSTIWNGRADNLAADGAPISISFEQQILITDCWIVPKGAANKDLAMKAIAIMSRPEVQARLSLFIKYAPANTLAFETGIIPPEIAERLPNHPNHVKKGFLLDADYWAENLDELSQRFDLFIQE